MRIHTDRLHRLAANLVLRNCTPGIIRLNNIPHFIFEINNQEVQVEPQIFSFIHLMPEIFPMDWVLNRNGEYVWIEDSHQKTMISLSKFFNIDFPMLGHFMIPGAQMVRLYGGIELKPISTNLEIAINIYKLIEAKEMWLDLPTNYNVYFSKN